MINFGARPNLWRPQLVVRRNICAGLLVVFERGATLEHVRVEKSLVAAFVCSLDDHLPKTYPCTVNFIHMLAERCFNVHVLRFKSQIGFPVHK